MAATSEEAAFSANEAAYVTGIPLRQVHRIIDAGLLGTAAKRRNGTRSISMRALVGLKLAHQTTEVLTLEGRRRLVRRVLDDPEARTVRTDAVSVDVRPMKSEVKRGLASLDKAKKMIVSHKEILGGAPCLKGTRIAVHDISDMLENGDTASAIVAAYPMLTEAQIVAAAAYAEAYPRRGRPSLERAWRKAKPLETKEVKLDKLFET